MTETVQGLSLDRAFKSEVIPLDQLTAVEDLNELFSRIIVTRYFDEVLTPGPGGRFEVDLSVTQEVVFELPGLNGFAVVLGTTDGTPFILTVGFKMTPDFWQLTLKGDLSLRFPQGWLRPVVRQNGKWVDDLSRKYTEISVDAGVIIDNDWNVSFDGTNEFSLVPSMIADTGFVVEGTIAIDFSESQSLDETLAMGLGDTWRGVVFKPVKLHLPDDLDVPVLPEELICTNFHIGSGGISGSVRGDWSPMPNGSQISGSGVGKLFGVAFGLEKLELDFVQNAVTGMEIKGYLALPFFDKAFAVDLGFDLNGNIFLAIAKSGGLLDFTYEIGTTKIFNVKLENLGFEIQDENCLIHIGGEIQPLVYKPPLQWPSFKVKDLMIDSDGNVSIDGGWLDIPQQQSLDFYGFQVEITKLGFGKEDDGTKWIGFSGGIKLVDGLPMGASVEGLRISWTTEGDVSVSFNGIGVQFEVPDVLRFAGNVSFIDDQETDEQYFKGAIKLDLISLGLTLDASLMVGKNEAQPESYSYFFIFLEAQLPAGIPLFSSGLALYGMAGLFANNMEPNKTSEEDWYEDWYKTKEPQFSVTDPEKKWDDQRDALAVGAGVTIGTLADNGYAFACRTMLVVVIPGPIIILEGRAQILSERTGLADDKEPPFKALVVIDGRAGTFLFNVEATYRQPQSSGAIIDLHAGAEGYFAGASDWHFYLGEKDPREKRIRAQIIKLLEANAYFMLDSSKVEMGAYLGFNRSWDFGPVHAGVEAWIEGGTLISWMPVHFAGYLWLHGALRVSIFGFGFGFRADARIEVQTPTPYYVLIALGVTIDLPWFLPDIEVEIELKWEEEADVPIPLPLKEIAFGHLKVTDTWSMEKPKLPVFDTDGDGFKDANPTTHDADKARQESPVVPMDARPVLTFARPMHDLLELGSAPPSPPSETVGDNDYRYELVSIKLEKWAKDGSASWQEVALALAPDQSNGELYGQWQAVGDKGQVATKLYLWSKNAFDILRAAGRTWADYFIEQNLGYPCLPAEKLTEICVNFDDLPVGTILPLAFIQGGLFFVSNQASRVVPHPHPSPTADPQQALFFPNLANAPLRIIFPNPVAKVSVYTEGGQVTVTAHYQGVAVSSPQTGNKMVTVQAEAIDWIEVTGIELWLLQVCYVTIQALADDLEWRSRNQGVQRETERWKEVEGYIFEPDTMYRLEVITQVKLAPKGTLPTHTGKWKLLSKPPFTEYGYFQTEGPPGLINLPDRKQGERTPQHPLTDLALYVTQPGRTIPGDDQRPGADQQKRKNEPPRPVYRGYDVGLEFNENYVELMYRLASRDLRLYVYDNNQRPVRDVQGRLLVLPNYWDEARQLELTLPDNLWIDTIDRATCVTINSEEIKRSDTVHLGDPRHILRPETLHEVRVIPLLLHDDFHSGNITAWSTPYAEGNRGDTPNWEVRSESIMVKENNGQVQKKNHYLIQTSNHHGYTPGVPADKPGTYLIRGDMAWTDYRLAVTLRSSDDDVIGVMFRYKDENNYYRFSMDKERPARQLIKKINGKVDVLAQDQVSFELDRDYQVLVEVIDDHICVYLDGNLLFDVKDGDLKTGQIGLYCWANQGARFDDVRVDDFSTQANPVYRFDLVTSRYVDFAHQLHAFRDAIWELGIKGQLTSNQLANLTAMVTAAQAQGMAYPPLEAKDFYGLFDLGQRPTPSALDVSLLHAGDQRYGLLLESPEPIRWERVDIPIVRRAERLLPPVSSPQAIKLIDATFAPETLAIDFDANKEYVDLMLRDDQDPSGHVIQHLRYPGSIEPVVKESILFTEDFAGGFLFSIGLEYQSELKQGVLSEGFGQEFESHDIILSDNLAITTEGKGYLWHITDEDQHQTYHVWREREALNIYAGGIARWTKEDEGTVQGPSHWATVGGVLRQTSNVHSEGDDPVEKPGTYLVAGEASWTNYRVTIRLRSDDNDAIGVMFRYKDKNNYYRFSMDSERRYRRLVKKINGTVTELWHDAEAFETGRIYTLTFDAFGERLQGFIDGYSLIDISDPDLDAGQIGLYCWGNTGANFFDVIVKSIPPKADLLFADNFEVGILTGWTAVNEGTVHAPSNWSITDKGVLKQTSHIHGEGTGPIDKPGTYYLAGDVDWTDYQFSVRLQSDTDGAIGVMFRYLDADNYYRFSMDRQQAYRRLVRKAGGVFTLLWEDSTPYKNGYEYTLVIDAFGDRLQGSIDSVPVFDVIDESENAPIQGKIGLYCWGNAGSYFDDVRVSRSMPAERVLFADDFIYELDHWTAIDEGTPSSPAAWKVLEGVLMHTAETHGGSLDPSSPDKPGTFVVRGDANWTDYRLSVRLRSDTEYALGVMARYKDPNNYYRFSMDRRFRYRRLIKKVGGVVSILWQDNVRYQVGQEYQVVLDVSGSQVRVIIDGVEICDVPDGDLDRGQIGLYCWGNSGARFDDVIVTTQAWVDHPLVEEEFSRFKFQDWSIVDLASVPLRPGWRVTEGMLEHTNQHPGTAVVTGTRHWTNYRFSTTLRTKQGAIGVAFGYQSPDNAFFFIMDQSRSRLIQQRGGRRDLLWEGRETFQPGEWHSLSIYLTSSQIEISLDSELLVSLPDTGGEGGIGVCAWGDDSAQFSAINVIQEMLQKIALLSEDFSAGMGAWTIFDEGTPSPPATWAVDDGVLTQIAETHGGSLDPSKLNKPGTFVITGDPTWSDYRLVARVRSESEYGIGVMFRYIDPDNYYRFSMDRRLGYRRLIRKFKGQMKLLWQDQIIYETGRDYLITVDAFGDRLQVYVDGVPANNETIIDATLPSGQIGLYCWGNSGAYFDEIKVLAPQFVDYYRFGNETRLPAGSVIRVHAGAMQHHTKPATDIEHRYIAQYGQEGHPLLSSAGDILRVVDKTGQIGHCRPFLPTSAYNSVPVVLLRSRDGTAAYLFFPDNGNVVGPVADGHYQLTFTFHRDISAKDPKAPVLRRAGSRTDEQATIAFMLPPPKPS